jgi:phage-related protein
MILACPTRSSTFEAEAEFFQKNLGGDYVLRIGKGLRGERRRARLEYRGTVTEILAIEAMLRQVAHRSFLIQDPDRGDWMRVVRDGRSSRSHRNGHIRSLKVTVREVFHP